MMSLLLTNSQPKKAPVSNRDRARRFSCPLQSNVDSDAETRRPGGHDDRSLVRPLQRRLSDMSLSRCVDPGGGAGLGGQPSPLTPRTDLPDERRDPFSPLPGRLMPSPLPAEDRTRVHSEPLGKIGVGETEPPPGRPEAFAQRGARLCRVAAEEGEHARYHPRARGGDPVLPVEDCGLVDADQRRGLLLKRRARIPCDIRGSGGRSEHPAHDTNREASRIRFWLSGDEGNSLDVR